MTAEPGIENPAQPESLRTSRAPGDRWRDRQVALLTLSGDPDQLELEREVFAREGVVRIQRHHRVRHFGNPQVNHPSVGLVKLELLADL